MAMPRCLCMHEAQLIEHRLLDEHAFLLLDPVTTRDPYWLELPGCSLAPKPLEADAGSLPRLVTIGALDQAQRDTLLARLLSAPAEGSQVAAALLTTDADVTRLASHLRERMIVSIPNHGRHVFRYYDPRVFRHLLWMAAPSQLAALFGPVAAWTWCDAHDRWRRSYPPEERNCTLSLRVADLDLARIGVLERCLKTLRRTLPDFIDDDDNVQARHISTLIDAALTHGLSDEADLQLYVAQAIHLHANIHTHPELVRRLRAAGEDDSYVGACSDLDAVTLARYVNELSRPRKEHA